MKFNGTKFQVVQYGYDSNLKDEYEYFTENTGEIIERFDNLRDLGVILSDNAMFDKQIEIVSKKNKSEGRMGLKNILHQKPTFHEINI